MKVYIFMNWSILMWFLSLTDAPILGHNTVVPLLALFPARATQFFRSWEWSRLSCLQRVQAGALQLWCNLVLSGASGTGWRPSVHRHNLACCPDLPSLLSHHSSLTIAFGKNATRRSRFLPGEYLYPPCCCNITWRFHYLSICCHLTVFHPAN